MPLWLLQVKVWLCRIWPQPFKYDKCGEKEADKKEYALQMAERTLKVISAGGIFDHIGGGFSRYSIDKKWLVTHFEKIL